MYPYFYSSTEWRVRKHFVRENVAMIRIQLHKSFGLIVRGKERKHPGPAYAVLYNVCSWYLVPLFKKCPHTPMEWALWPMKKKTLFTCFYHISSYYILDVLWGQPIKLIQVASNSELRENQWNDHLFFEIIPSHCFRASEASKIDCFKN